jgi:DeoR/GlpR family transcriptional regulator of sugar metabolism
MSVATDPAARGLNARERRERIAELVEIDQRVNVADLTERFGVTDASIRRDLTILENAGRLRRVHGGAVGRGGQLSNGVYAIKLRARREQKARIAAVAARLVRTGEVVLFDSGTTVAQVAAQMPSSLRAANAITAVTHSLPVIEEIGSWDNPICLPRRTLPARLPAFVGRRRSPACAS